MGNEQLKKEWRKRAKEKGFTLSSVLLGNLPPVLNGHLHYLHSRLIRELFLPNIPQNSVLLDVACGYGRLSAVIKELRPDVRIVGADFVRSYCGKYSVSLQQSVVCADITRLPFVKNTFDGILAVTALMYVDSEQLQTSFEDIIDLVKPEGYVLFVDPSLEYRNLINFFKKSKTSTSGEAFSYLQYQELSRNKKVKMVRSGGWGAFSLLLPFLYFISNFGGLTQCFLRFSLKIDSCSSFFEKLSIHRWILLKKK